MNKVKDNFKNLPVLEIATMLSSVILAYVGLALVAGTSEHIVSERELSGIPMVMALFGFFLISIAIALISVVAGIGGGVIFTPIMLAFTGVDSVIIRGTGLIVAMFSGLISTGIFVKKGLGNYKLCLVMMLSQSIGALFGGILAINIADSFGIMGEGFLRLSLGVILICIAVYFYIGGKKLDWPVIKKIDKFSSFLKLGMSYYEESEHTVKHYEVTRVLLGIVLIFGVGIMGGFFGMGGGWAITPVLNMGIGLPLKLAAANSGIILGVGSCVSIWPYIFAGSLIPLFVLPWLSGQVIGGFAGSYVLAKIKVNVVRIILIGIMFFTSFGLITKAFSMLKIIDSVPPIFQIVVFGLIMAWVIFVIIRGREKQSNNDKNITLQTAEKLSVKAIYIPQSHIVYSNIVHWITIVSSVASLFVPVFILFKSSRNMLNPNLILGAIFSGASISEIWGMSQIGIFSGAHSYFSYPGFADSWALFFINLGCSVALWAIIPAIILQIFKEKDYFTAFLGTIFAVLVLFSMTGLLNFAA